MRNLSAEQVTLIASRARALGEPIRVRILEVLSRGEQPVGQIAGALDTQPSSISKHLQVLFHAGLVQRRREASTVIYSMAEEDLLEWLRYLGARHLGATPRGRASNRV